MPPEAVAPGEITFRRIDAGDLPLLGRWMQAPHWREWWGEPETELGYIRDMIEGRDSTEPYFALIAGEPVAYVQVWIVADARTEPWLTQAPWVAWLPDNAVGADISLGDGVPLGQGIGQAVLRAFVADLRARGHDVIIIDPDPANARAVAAYRKAGFETIPEFLGKTGDSLLMRHLPQE